MRTPSAADKTLCDLWFPKVTAYAILTTIRMTYFWQNIVVRNWPRYLVVILVCLIYAFGFQFLGPKWYRAEATLLFKNRSDVESFQLTRLTRNPLPMFLEQQPVEEQYELSNLLYSVNLADRVIGERLEELYAEGEYTGLDDFYEEFLLSLGYQYDEEMKTVVLSYTFTDPDVAAEFCNGFAQSLEDFLLEIVQKAHISHYLRARLNTAIDEAATAEEEVGRIMEEYNIPDLIHGPVEWIQAYAKAEERTYRSEAEMRMLLAALQQINQNRQRRNLLAEPETPPDTTIVQDLITSVLRWRLAIINAAIDVSGEVLTEDSPALDVYTAEAEMLRRYIGQQYSEGLDIEAASLLLMFEESIVKNYLFDARAEETYERLASLPRLEAEVRPAIRAANAANAVVSQLDKFSAMTEIGEEYGQHPVRVIDSAVSPVKPTWPAFSILTYLLPTMLLISTLWFGLAQRLVVEHDSDENTGVTKGS